MVSFNFARKEVTQNAIICRGHAATEQGLQPVCKMSPLCFVLRASPRVCPGGGPSLEMGGGIKCGQGKDMGEVGEYSEIINRNSNLGDQ